jgi:hypothetical protein
MANGSIFGGGASGAAVFGISAAPIALADSADRIVCSGDEKSGADVDDCLPNPNADIGSDLPGAYPQLLPSLVFGVGG